jgi:hypothetical protein
MPSVAPTRPSRRSRARWRVGVVLLVVLAAALWLRGGLFGKQYEYEEDLTIALDGSARLTVNASLASLVAMRGLDLDPLSRSVDRERIAAAYASPVTTVASVPRPWQRRGRTFVQVNLEIEDIRRLHESPPLAWSRYELFEQDGETVFRQTVGESALRRGTLQNVGWTGGELVAFRLHLPARVLEHNARTLEDDRPGAIRRGNILAWEQFLTDRLDGQPVSLVVRMESRSILFLTLWLFAGAFLAAVSTLGLVIWWTIRRGRATEAARSAA